MPLISRVTVASFAATDGGMATITSSNAEPIKILLVVMINDLRRRLYRTGIPELTVRPASQNPLLLEIDGFLPGIGPPRWTALVSRPKRSFGTSVQRSDHRP